MLTVRHKCPRCGEIFKRIGVFADADSVSKCPRCGESRAPLVEEDKKQLELEAKRCSSCG